MLTALLAGAKFVGGLLKPFALKILLVVAAGIGILLLLSRMKEAGRAEALAEGVERQLKNVERRNEVEREVGRLSGDAVRERLRERWTRD